MKKNFQNDEFLRKRYERQRQIRKRRAKICLIFFLIILLAVGAVLSVTVFFPIKNITAKGSKIYTPTQIIENSGIDLGDNLIVVSKNKTLNNLKSKLPFVEGVEISRSFPDTLTLKVTDAKEHTCYKVGKNYYSVSKSGWVLKSYSKKPKDIMFVITDKVKCKVGNAIEFSDESVKETSKTLIDTLTNYKLSVEYVDITEKLSIKAKVEDRFIVNFGSSKDLESKTKHLKAMIREIGENATGKIDLSMWSIQNTQGAFTETKIK